MKEALDLYVMQRETFNNKEVELLEEINNPTDRKIIWVVDKSFGESKTLLQKYISSRFGVRRVVSGSIKFATASIF